MKISRITALLPLLSFALAGCGGDNLTLPAPPAENRAVAVSAGSFHACAILAGGEARCWGRNDGGQLGNGSQADSVFPVSVRGIADAVGVSAGDGHSCVVLSSGGVKCWGSNRYGQLGDGSQTDSSIPVSANGVSGAIGVSAGEMYTCAALSGGEVWCWGLNYYGQLGNSTVTYSSTPLKVIGIEDAVSVSAGRCHACAVLSGGEVWCWGYNVFGQLGDGTQGFASFVPVRAKDIAGAVSVSAGDYFTCALLSGGEARCWGANSYGVLGDGSTTDSLTPVVVNGITDAISISASVVAFACAALSGGESLCWGYNYYGQLGDGSQTNSAAPVNVNGVADAIQISVGAYHACAVLSGGRAQCWGWNNYGQLGNGSHTDSSVPVNVKNL
jgi:alpha-tubulin suppressor-like RCC1 family protein